MVISGQYKQPDMETTTEQNQRGYVPQQPGEIIIKRISRAPMYCTRWEHRALYSNTKNTHIQACTHASMHARACTHTHTRTHTHTHTHWQSVIFRLRTGLYVLTCIAWRSLTLAIVHVQWAQDPKQYKTTLPLLQKGYSFSCLGLAWRKSYVQISLHQPPYTHTYIYIYINQISTHQKGAFNYILWQMPSSTYM